MTFNGIFIDDNDDEAVYAEQLSTRNKLKLGHERPRSLTVHSIEIFNQTPDLLALDYRLDENLGDLEDNEAYKASAMAQQIRDLAIDAPNRDFPIVLVSSEDKIRDQYEPDKTSHDLFDALFVKSEINDNRAPIRTQLVSLCEGYHLLREQIGGFALPSLLGLSGDDVDILDYQELTVPISRAAAPHIVAAIVLNQIILRNGPLITLGETCARLGVDLHHQEQIAELMFQHSADYRGIFSSGWPRFWSYRVDDVTEATFGRKATGFTSEERAQALTKILRTAMNPARSPWTGKTDELISFACACCGEGTEMRHSVGVFETNLPSFSKRRRVCWRCVHEDRHLDLRPPITMDSADEDLIADIKAMQRPT